MGLDPFSMIFIIRFLSIYQSFYNNFIKNEYKLYSYNFLTNILYQQIFF